MSRGHFEEDLRVHLEEKGEFIRENSGVASSEFHACLTHPNRLIKFLSRSSMNKNKNYTLSSRFISEADRLIEAGWEVFVITSENGKQYNWNLHRHRVDKHRGFGDGHACISF